MDANLLYSRMLSLKAKGKSFILILTKETINQLVKNEIPEANMDDINTADMWFAGVHVYLGLMDKIVLIEGEIWLE